MWTEVIRHSNNFTRKQPVNYKPIQIESNKHKWAQMRQNQQKKPKREINNIDQDKIRSVQINNCVVKPTVRPPVVLVLVSC